MEKDYSELEKTTFTFSEYEEEGIVIGLVAGCDIDIGITVVDKANPKREILCINGPLSPNKNEYKKNGYLVTFLAAVEMIKQDKFNTEELREIWFQNAYGGYSPIGGCVMGECAFKA